jgi:hypothetical protein
MIIDEVYYNEYMGVTEAPKNFKRLYIQSVSIINYIYACDLEVIYEDFGDMCKDKVKFALCEQIDYLNYHLSMNLDAQVTPTYVAIADFMYTMEKANGANLNLIFRPIVKTILDGCISKRSAIVGGVCG